jgi:beta-galactosidase/beta-glucuronidase
MRIMTETNISWKPVEGHIISRWAKQVDPGNVLPEYPRPQMVRDRWQNLNGLWDYAIVPKSTEQVSDFEGKILVPFPVESALSGVKKPLLPQQRLWYRRRFTIPETWGDDRVLLHFGAVDYQAQIWVNGVYLGEHLGGHLPFSFDITEQIQSNTDHELVVAVWDPSDAGNQERGKQVLKPKQIWYTAASGIWQTVWLEPVPETRIDRLKITPDIDTEQLHLTTFLHNTQPTGLSVSIVAKLDGGTVAEKKGKPGDTISLPIPSPQLWSPDSPTLYDLEISLQSDGKHVDRVDSYFGMRKFHIAPDENGHQRIFLNNQPLFHYGPLDQGYWPDGLYTAPTDAALLYDIEYAKKIGCNMIRKHIKVEPARWYYHCDRLGVIVWQDMPNGGKPVGGLISILALLFNTSVDDRKRLRQAGRLAPENREQFRRELKGMIDWLYNAPCIGMWVPFNEAWGQFNAHEFSEWVKEYDPTRPVDHASGWFDQGAGDFQSLHVYFRALKMPKLDPKRAFILSEFGGYSLMLKDNAWNHKKKFGYRFFDSGAELTEAYVSLIQEQLRPLISQGLAGAVYTQTTDVEIEINGYLTYDRETEKMDVEKLIEVHQTLYD